MQISVYLGEMEHAIRHVLGEVYRERDVAEQLGDKVRNNTAAMEHGYRQAESLAMDPDLDDEGLSTAIYWETYFGADKDRHDDQIDLDEVKQRIEVRKFSTVALAASVLQYAKQGIALRFVTCPTRSGAPARRLGRLGPCRG
jgi:hypothetical protein